NDIAGAIENLEKVVEADHENVALRERLLGLCVRASDWTRAVREHRELARQRPTPLEKAREELQLALMQRDKLGDREGARLSLDRARTLDPLNLEVVRELVDLLDAPARAQVLAATATNLRTSITQAPDRSALYERLAQITAWQSEVDARWLALVGLEVLGSPSVDQQQVLAQGRTKLPAPSRWRLDANDRAALGGAQAGALRELWRTIAPSVQVATGVDASKLGFARGDKLALKKLGDKYEPLATALACFGLEDVEIYIAASRTGVARALAGDTPILCLGADVASASTPQARFLLGRVVASVAEDVGTIPDLRDGEVSWTIVAALKAAEAPVPAALAELVGGLDVETSIVERTKMLKKELSRKAKSVVVQLAQQRGGELVDARSCQAAREARARRERCQMSTGGKPPPGKPSFLGGDDLFSELDAWDATFDALHAEPAEGATPEPMLGELTMISTPVVDAASTIDTPLPDHDEPIDPPELEAQLTLDGAIEDFDGAASIDVELAGVQPHLGEHGTDQGDDQRADEADDQDDLNATFDRDLPELEIPDDTRQTPLPSVAPLVVPTQPRPTSTSGNLGARSVLGLDNLDEADFSEVGMEGKPSTLGELLGA
ncbi:MAG: hypothetical protein NT062_38305, partial [Proteobacteria bacterium]|nr:hypothetical protein [Pseudomonadota bacterium]